MEKILELTKKYKEILLYGIFGVLTTVVNFIVYFIFYRQLEINIIISNNIAWFLSVLFAYVTNKIFVFESKSLKANEVLKESVSFFGARLFTLVVETLMLLVSVNVLHINDLVAKIVANIVVILLNYFLSKLWIFKKSENN